MAQSLIQGEEIVYYMVRFQEGSAEYQYLDRDGGELCLKAASRIPYCWCTAGYEEALNMVTAFQKADLPFNDKDYAALTDMKFRLLGANRNFVNGSNIQVHVRLKSDVFIELCSVRVCEGQGRDSGNTWVNDRIHALVRYKLAYDFSD